jgi:hypothetical protein
VPRVALLTLKLRVGHGQQRLTRAEHGCSYLCVWLSQQPLGSQAYGSAAPAQNKMTTYTYICMTPLLNTPSILILLTFLTTRIS